MRTSTLEQSYINYATCCSKTIEIRVTFDQGLVEQPSVVRYGENAPRRVDWSRHRGKSCWPLWCPGSCRRQQRESRFSLFPRSSDTREILPVLCWPTCASGGRLRREQMQFNQLYPYSTDGGLTRANTATDRDRKNQF